MASTYLSKTYGSAGNRKTMTFSFWIKRGNLSTAQYPMSIIDSGSGNQADMRFDATTDVFRMYSTDTSGTPFAIHLVTDRVFRDTSAWYHIVWEIDTTQATESDRVKLYINGVRETSFSTETYPAQNTDLRWNGTSGSTGGVTQIGAINGNGAFDGSMAHVHFIDGTAYDASTFGETDATTGIWKPKTAPSVTYGTNGFFLKFASAGSLGTDSSGNGNNFTVNGSGTQTQDTPSNVFATLNPLHRGSYLSGLTFSNGNNTIVSSEGGSNYPYTYSTLAVSSGKYYSEFKCTSNPTLAMCGISSGVANQYLGNGSEEYGYFGDNGSVYNSGTSNAFGSSLSANDVVQVAMDLDNNYVYFGINGTWQNSGDPTSGATGTGGFSITATSSLSTGVYHFACGDAGTETPTIQANFGNGYFGTTAVSSAQSPSDGIGLFEYAVPSGYKALCTKSINAQEYS